MSDLKVKTIEEQDDILVALYAAKTYTPRNPRNTHSKICETPRTYFIQSERGVRKQVVKTKIQGVDEHEESSKSDSYGPSNGSTVYDETVTRFQSIAALTEEENANLKQQNQFLINKLRKMKEREQKILKMYQSAKKYKRLYQETQVQLESLEQECEVYKYQAQQMKKIALFDVQNLKEKLVEAEAGEGDQVEKKLEER